MAKYRLKVYEVNEDGSEELLCLKGKEISFEGNGFLFAVISREESCAYTLVHDLSTKNVEDIVENTDVLFESAVHCVSRKVMKNLYEATQSQEETCKTLN